VVFACGDGNFGADRLTWIAWGGPRAVGTGSAFATDCRPNCAAGRFHRYRIVLIVEGSQRCPGGALAYRRVTYAFIGRPPPPGGTADPRVPFPCTAG